MAGVAYPVPAGDPPGAAARNSLLQITGRRFLTGITVQIGGVASPGFPNAGLGETRTDTALQVFIRNSVPTGARPVTLRTAGGTIEATLTVTL
jgi:hypothetical protein